ncbi:MAG: HD domain-containing protein [Actinobacteria bacterium]|nr:HD domain-containing protein [Actinomycetota bacterium]
MNEKPLLKKQFIGELAPGMAVDSVFLLTKKILKKKKSGEDYCIICLQDRSGSLDGVIWTEAYKNLGVFVEGNFVRVKGEVSDYKGARQLSVSFLSSLERSDEDKLAFSDYVRISKRDSAEMFSELNTYIDRMENNHLKSLLESFFNAGDFKESFCKSSAAVQYHHAYIGGLLEHTLSMVKICNYLSENYKNINKDLLITGAILHDIGKVIEYVSEKRGALIKITDEGRLLGHITIGYGMVLEKINEIKKFPKELKDRLLHIILSHHGHKEFGSPKRPKTLEAFIVYHVDHLDADIGGFTFILEESGGLSDWSEYLRNFERSIFLKNPDYENNLFSDSSGSGDTEEIEDYNSNSLEAEKAADSRQHKPDRQAPHNRRDTQDELF